MSAVSLITGILLWLSDIGTGAAQFAIGFGGMMCGSMTLILLCGATSHIVNQLWSMLTSPQASSEVRATTPA